VTDEIVQNLAKLLYCQAARIARSLQDWLVSRTSGPILEVAPSSVEENDSPFLGTSMYGDPNRVRHQDRLAFRLEAWGPSRPLISPRHRSNDKATRPPTVGAAFNLADGKVQVD
jgi:hypothetical protein